MKETIISTSTAQQLFSLVRASLWQLPVDLKPFKDASVKHDATVSLSMRKAVDWDAIGKMASQQTVVILMINAALSLPSELIPSKEWILKAYSLLERNRRTHLLVDNCVAEAIHCLKEVIIRATLLKGQAYARSYPDPVLRQCGDIDLYLGEENFNKAYQLNYSKKSERILSLILEEGNFGRYKTKQSLKPQGYWSRKIHTFHELNRTMVPRLSIDPRRVVNNYCRTLGYGIRGALIHLLRL